MIFDAHNHLQDVRLNALNRATLLEELRTRGLNAMVVNATHPGDWEAVLQLAKDHPGTVLPAFGVHPWKVKTTAGDWAMRLQSYLDAADGFVGVGEIGLDRWIEEPDFERQREFFRQQLALAAERNLPVSIHCLRAWGPLLEELQQNPLPTRGFHLHAPGASAETLKQLAELGAYFSIPGSFAHPDKPKYLKVISCIPEDRLLIETDAPDMLPSVDFREAECKDPETGEALCHPLNILSAYRAVARIREVSLSRLEACVADNFQRFFLSDRDK